MFFPKNLEYRKLKKSKLKQLFVKIVITKNKIRHCTHYVSVYTTCDIEDSIKITSCCSKYQYSSSVRLSLSLSLSLEKATFPSKWFPRQRKLLGDISDRISWDVCGRRRGLLNTTSEPHIQGVGDVALTVIWANYSHEETRVKLRIQTFIRLSSEI